MSFSRLYRLLKPALLCGALAAPGLASTMVSAAPPAGQRAVGRARDLPSGDLGRGAPAAPSAAIRTVAGAREGVTVRVWVGGRGGVRGAGDRLGGRNPLLEAPDAHRLLYRGSCGWRRRPLAPRLRPGERGRPKRWKSGITRHGSSLPLPRPARPGAPCGGVTEERPGALGYRPFVPGARLSVGTSSVRDLRAWAAQPPAPRVVAGSGAGCRPGDGAEPPEGAGLGYAVAGGRAPGGGGQLLRALG